MRESQWRLVFSGLALVIVAVGAYAIIGPMLPAADDDARLHAALGAAALAATVVGLALAVYGLIGRRR